MYAEHRIAVIARPAHQLLIGSVLAALTTHQRDFQFLDVTMPPVALAERLHALAPAGAIAVYDPAVCELLFGRFPRMPLVVMLADLLVASSGVVNVDDYALGRTAARHLLDNGWRSLAYYGQTPAHAPQRLAGFIEEARRAGVEPDVRTDRRPGPVPDCGWQPAPAVLCRWLAALPKPVAVFAASEGHGQQVVDACRALELSIPDCVALVVAADDPQFGSWQTPALSVASLPWHGMTRLAVEMVDAALAGVPPAAEPVLVAPGAVHQRASTLWVACRDPLVAAALAFARQQVADGLPDGLSIESWAMAMGTNRRALERAFRRSLGQSPHQAVLKLQVERACEQLRWTDWPIARIAEACGFGRAEKLSTHFRRVTGTTPRAYRKRTR
jgi:LacI family transcriptional regulator